MVSSECEINRGTRSNRALIYKEDGLDGKDELLGEAKRAGFISPGDKARETCKLIYLDDLVGFSSQFWN